MRDLEWQIKIVETLLYGQSGAIKGFWWVRGNKMRIVFRKLNWQHYVSRMKVERQKGGRILRGQISSH